MLTSKLRLHYDVHEDNVQGASSCKTPPYQNAAEQPPDPTQGGDAGQLYPASARRQARSSPAPSSSFCAGSESFPAPGRLPGGTTVVASATTLLACPFAGHQRSVHTTTYRTKTGQACQSFGTVSLCNRATSGSGKSADRPAGERPPVSAQVVDNLWTTGGVRRVQHVKCGAGSGSRRTPGHGDGGAKAVKPDKVHRGSVAMGVARRWPIRST